MLYTQTHTLYLCVPLLFHHLFLQTVPKEFPFAAPRAAVCCLPASSSSLPLSVTANEGGVSLSFLSLTTSRRNLGCSSSETGADLRANTCVPAANLRGFEPGAAQQQKNQNNRRGTGESNWDERAGCAELPEGPKGQPFPRHPCLSRAPGILLEHNRCPRHQVPRFLAYFLQEGLMGS